MRKSNFALRLQPSLLEGARKLAAACELNSFDPRHRLLLLIMPTEILTGGHGDDEFQRQESPEIAAE
jgi:hypothetical protein